MKFILRTGRRLVPWTVLIVIGLGPVGCAPSFFRQRADREVECLVAHADVAVGGVNEPFSIVPQSASRFAQIYAPDCEPMPIDDPVSHQLMQCVDCKRGAPCWYQCGVTDTVENLAYRAYLPVDEAGVTVLDVRGAVDVARVNSRTYQDQLENLYLSALDVSVERFRFDTQFFGGNDTFFSADGRERAGSGGESSSLLTVDTSASARKLFATGGDLAVGVANSLIWQFSGPNTHSNLSVVDLSFVQPLLRAAGRAVVLEGLTLAERRLLANVRQLERFRRGFYGQIYAGLTPGRGPLSGGGFLNDLGIRRVITGGGYLGLLRDQQLIRNEEANVAALRLSLEQLTEFFSGGPDRGTTFTQVGLAAQALFNAQSRLLTRRNQYQQSLDAYKIILGLPPSLELSIRDPLLNRFQLIDPQLIQLREQVQAIRDEIRASGPEIQTEELGQVVATLLQRAEGQLTEVWDDFEQSAEALPERKRALTQLVGYEYGEGAELQASLPSPQAIEERAETLKAELDALSERLQKTGGVLGTFISQDMEAGNAASHQRLKELLGELFDELLELSVIQVQARLETIVLQPVALQSPQALAIARSYRRDWMNARAALVDQWRQIRIAANALRSDLDLRFEGDISTLGDNPVKFRSSTGRLRVGVEFDAPLTRLIEQNDYRATLIDYQRARRDYMLFEDRVDQSLRDILRNLRLGEVNFEIRREAVRLAATRYDVVRFELTEPTPPGVVQARSRPTTARDLVEALNDLLTAQNAFVSAWVDYQAQRLQLDFELGTMQLDPAGHWIDPGTGLGAVPAFGGEPLAEPVLPELEIEELPPTRLPQVEAAE